ncbi:MAG: terminase large subunit domain-containing protein [Caulobacter sp.]
MSLAEADPMDALHALNCADARDSFAAFCGIVEIPGVSAEDADDGVAIPAIRDAHLADHHRLWIEKLEAVERGDIKRLMGFMPPGAAKSTYAVDLFTPWYLGRKAGRNVIAATYSTTQVRKRGRKARAVVRQKVFNDIFGVGLSSETKAAEEWELTNGSGWMGGGIRAGITGNRADLIVIDDPVKGREEADSETIRARTKEEFDDSVRTRLKANAAIILIQTRWHEDDLAGSILPPDYDGQSGPVLCRDGEVWEVVNIPAQAERPDDPLGRRVGEYLWPEYWPESHWGQFKANPRTWSALYQQRPKPDEGTYFGRSLFRRFRHDDADLPRSLILYGTSDYAVTDKGGDWTVLTIWGVDPAHHVWRVASWRGQTASDGWIRQQVEMMREYRNRYGGLRRWIGEAGVIQKAIEPQLMAKMREERVSCALQWLPSINDKATRARAAQSLVNEGRIHVRDDSDGDCFIDECVAFPAGKHDDEVDNLSLLGRVLDRLERPSASREGWDSAAPDTPWTT